VGDLGNWCGWVMAKEGRALHAEGVGDPVYPHGIMDPWWESYRIVGLEADGERARVGLRKYNKETALKLIAEVHRTAGIPPIRSIA